MNFQLSSLAKSDVLEIADYYADISDDLAEGFVADLEAALHTLCSRPDMGSLRYAHFLPNRSLRVWQLNHFPYLLFYRTDKKVLDLLRILHERRGLSASLIPH